MCELTILMPCLNEAATVAICVDKAVNFLKQHGIDGEVLIADNGSTDGSRELAVEHGARVQPVASRGYGAALMGGIESARGRFIIMGDADDSYDFTRLMPFVEKLREGYELVMGNRFRGGIAAGAMPPLHQYLGNPVLSWIGRLFFRSEIGDFYCGLRGFSKEAMQRVGLQMTGMEFAMEMVVRSTQKRLKITEVPTTLSPDGRGRAPHLNTWRDGWKGLRFLLIFSPRWLFLYPGLVLVLFGLTLFAWIGPATRFVHGIGFDVRTLLYGAAAIVLGTQAISFALFTKVFTAATNLVPADDRVSRAARYFSVERGLLWGGSLFVAGVLGSVYAVILWEQSAFGPLGEAYAMRLIIFCITAMIVGVQTVLIGFFLGILALYKRQ